MKYEKLYINTVLCVSVICTAQEKKKSDKKIELGTELQIYPVGFIPMLTSNIFISEKWAMRFKVGGNFANREVFSGYNDDEIAKGFGASFGLVRYFLVWKG